MEKFTKVMKAYYELNRVKMLKLLQQRLMCCEEAAIDRRQSQPLA